MRKLLLLFLVLVVFIKAGAQGNLKGAINGNTKDAVSGQPVEYATITVYTISDNKVITGTASDKKGAFRLTGLAEGNYRIVIEAINYQPREFDSVTILKRNTPLDLGSISLAKKTTTLQGIVVIGTRGLIENKIDKLVFNAEKDLTSHGGAATDILKKVPQVSVDVDGNVQLAGSNSIRFLINGRPSAAFGSNIADVLASIPASQIKSIEVVTNPGAKYDAQGLGGIINIILKQSKINGINGNISLSAGTRMDNGSVNLNARQGNFGFNFFVSGNVRLKATTPSAYKRLTKNAATGTQSLLLQGGSFEVERSGYQSGFGFDWQYKKKNAFTGSLSFNKFGNRGNGFVNQQQQTSSLATGATIQDILTGNSTSNDFSFKNTAASLNYKRTFNKEDQELEIGFNSSSGRNHSMLDNYQALLPKDSIFYGTGSNNPAKEYEKQLNLDYTQPIRKDMMLGLGGKISFYDINSSSVVNSFDPASGIYKFNTGLSNELEYRQKVYALYSEISFAVGKLFDAKLGGRYERTELESYYSNAQQQVKTPGYNTFVPSIFFSKKLDDDQILKLNYSKRIEHPDFEDLNPFVNTADPKNISSGNPYLLPEIGQRVELSYNRNVKKAGSFMLTVFYRVKELDIQPYLVYYPTFKVGDSVFNNVTVSTRQNIGTEKNAGANLFADMNITGHLNIRVNLSAFYRHTINGLDQGFNSNSWNYRFNMNAAYQFSPLLAGEFFGNFNSARNELQGKYPSFTSYSFAVRQQLWNKKGSLALVVNNAFSKYVNQQTKLYGPNFSVDSYRKIPFRSIGINFTWKFGKLEFKKRKEEPDTNLAPDQNN
ncbi:MAG: TonB-dependent receptor [Ferruginibacter sp.]